MVDLDRLPPGHPLPAGLIGTPTYLLDGRVRWLGNPDPDELLSVWDEHADRDAGRDVAGVRVR